MKSIWAPLKCEVDIYKNDIEESLGINDLTLSRHSRLLSSASLSAYVLR